MNNYILAIDQGTSSSRAIVINEQAHVVSYHQIEHQQRFPKASWVEHDPGEIWNNVLRCCILAVEKKNISPHEIITIGITNQRETIIIWDKKTGEPIYPAIVWQDRRTADVCLQMKQAGNEVEINQRCGLLLDPYFSASKISWILNHVSGARRRAEQGELAAGTMDSFLLWRLTQGKVHATDISNAARTCLFNIHDLCWDQELLHLFNIPEQILPRVRPNNFNYGEATALFDRAIPIHAMAGDQQAASIGQACFKPGMIKSTYGTGAFLLMNTGDKAVTSKHRLLTTILYQINNDIHYALEGSIFTAGAGVKWLRDSLQIIDVAGDTEAMAAQLTDNGGVYFVPAFTGLGAPHWQPKARAKIMGLTPDTGREHIVRALLESICYQTKDLLLAMEQDANLESKLLRVDGGMACNNWLLQFLSDILQVSVERPAFIETTALGVAYLAGLQAGLFHSLDEVASLLKREQVFSPIMPQQHSSELYKQWNEAIQFAIMGQT